MLPHAGRVWGGLILGAAILDVVCDRGEPNGDTLTEQTCALIDAIPFGRALFPALCVGIPAWFYNHIEHRYDLRLQIMKSLGTPT